MATANHHDPTLNALAGTLILDELFALPL